jgi:hypothetical protein
MAKKEPMNLIQFQKILGARGVYLPIPSTPLQASLSLTTLFSERPLKAGNVDAAPDKLPCSWHYRWTKRDCPKYLKMQVIPDVKGTTLVDFAQKYIEAQKPLLAERITVWTASTSKLIWMNSVTDLTAVK